MLTAASTQAEWLTDDEREAVRSSLGIRPEDF